jgi:hypothetical protein
LRTLCKSDIETRKSCGGRVKMIACIGEPVVIEKILTHIERQGRSTAAARLPPFRRSPGSMKAKSWCEKGLVCGQHRVEA